MGGTNPSILYRNKAERTKWVNPNRLRPVKKEGPAGEKVVNGRERRRVEVPAEYHGDRVRGLPRELVAHRRCCSNQRGDLRGEWGFRIWLRLSCMCHIRPKVDGFRGLGSAAADTIKHFRFELWRVMSLHQSLGLTSPHRTTSTGRFSLGSGLGSERSDDLFRVGSSGST